MFETETVRDKLDDLEVLTGEINLKLHELSGIQSKLQDLVNSITEVKKRFELIQRVLVLQKMEACQRPEATEGV